ncbi:ISL3 family transposase [Paracraurococcus sp. LOR1-02]|uniref:ISL3 family transposase n=1 Tax=Paracraurococcus lichenis TaxID=3064888 RepID=A0ABT9ECL9_9PROT|nr:ISL3 family transposase [Paracraurococcus sp. LOR1-02]MDO9713877.1 ISL3 family transposase [Paracraurococcus sp. LOR1-02]
MFEHLSSLIPAGLLVQQILPSPDHLTIVVAPREPCATCPTCAMPSSHVHSRYDRLLHDLPWQGRQVLLRVRARRFRCLVPACPRLTFAERLADTAPAAARRTERLADLQRHLCLVVGGEVGARLAARLAVPVSADTLLRMARRAGAIPQPRPPVRVLAVDEWAWRRGHRYGTVLVDLERNRVVDLLPDRQAESLAAWLKANPSVAIIARDRAGVFADGIRQGAPGAIEVADRWHLLRNLGDAVHAAAQHHHAAARRIGKEIMAHPPHAGTPGEATAEPTTAVQRRSSASHAHRQAQFEEAARLHAAGASLSAIARQLGLNRKTLRCWLQAGAVPTWHKPRRDSLLDPYRDHLERRWSEGCHNATRLWQELVALGFPGRLAIVSAWATERRRAVQNGSGMPVTAEGEPWRPPSGRRVARLLMTDARILSPPDQAFAAQLLKEAPDLESTVAAAKRLRALLRRRSEETLADVLAAAEETQLVGFVAVLRRDISAVEAALTLPWTTSPAEGQVNRIKMIKRTMYGRAGFELLRARVLHAA